MSLNPTVYFLLAVYGLIFVGAALLVLRLLRARAGRVASPGDFEAERPVAPALATLATVSLAGVGDGAEPGPSASTSASPRRFRFFPARALRREADAPSDPAVSNVHIQVDALLIQRLSEFLEKRGESDEQAAEGCVVVVTDALPPAAAPERGARAAYLSGASAALSLARALAEARERSFHTLLIDTGSPAWSVYGVHSDDNPDVDQSDYEDDGGEGGGSDDDEELLRPHTAPDIVPLPEQVSGVYDVIAGREALDDCLLAEEDAPRLTALAPGEMPLRWPELLRSAGMRRLLGASRAVAEVVLVYAPRAAEYPEQVRQLARWADGVIVVGAAFEPRAATRAERDRRSQIAEFERAASQGLRPIGPGTEENSLAPLLGRIALDFASAAEADSAASPLEILHDSTPKRD